tara:strand:+ start:240 stop:680 length:441 start_codon:yes stop_codon:yes gene_type:complete
MANMRIIEEEVEPYIRDYFLPKEFPGHSFHSKKMTKVYGDEFNVDAVSGDDSIVCEIFSSKGKTVGGRENPNLEKKVGLITHYFNGLINSEEKAKLFVFTDKEAYEIVIRKKHKFPGVQFFHCTLPEEIATSVDAALTRASREITG